MDRDVIYKKFPEYVAADRLKPIEMDPKNYKTVYTIRIRLIKVHRLVVADKLTNRLKYPGRFKILIFAERCQINQQLYNNSTTIYNNFG